MMRCAASMRATSDTSGFLSMRRTNSVRRSRSFRRGWNRFHSGLTRDACSKMSRVCRRWPISFWTCSASTSRPTGCPTSISSPSGRKVAADLAPLAIAAGYELSFETATESTSCVRGDQGSLERALTNLIQNAIQHGGRKGLHCGSGGPPATISVTDDGPGIPLADRERVFEPFYRLQGRDRGAGLGSQSRPGDRPAA